MAIVNINKKYMMHAYICVYTVAYIYIIEILHNNSILFKFFFDNKNYFFSLFRLISCFNDK